MREMESTAATRIEPASFLHARGDHGVRHLSGLPFLVLRTRSTIGAAFGLSSLARAIASACVGTTALALCESGLRTA